MPNDEPQAGAQAAAGDAPNREQKKPGGESAATKPDAGGAGAAAGSAAAGAGGDKPTFPPAPMNEKIATLREATTTVIAGVVVLATLGMLVWTFLATADTAQKKDIMLYGLPILGTVLGYYFGRVPAERRAESAELDRGQAQATANQAVASAASARETAQASARGQQEAEKKLGIAKTAIENGMQAMTAALGPPGAGAGKPQRKTLGGPGEAPAGSAEIDAMRRAHLELLAASRLL